AHVGYIALALEPQLHHASTREDSQGHVEQLLALLRLAQCVQARSQPARQIWLERKRPAFPRALPGDVGQRRGAPRYVGPSWGHVDSADRNRYHRMAPNATAPER